jgi:hypothetical protein
LLYSGKTRIASALMFELLSFLRITIQTSQSPNRIPRLTDFCLERITLLAIVTYSNQFGVRMDCVPLSAKGVFSLGQLLTSR